jgi:nitroimidazol reductase NimA-like FMN-containing flavoprotein (pyridoxamine 5'-phosphate oxidase superfamily)
MSDHPDLDAIARRVIDANHYMTLATRDDDGRARLSPVYYTCARYSDFYWVSAPQARHSHNIGERPTVEIVIFDSTAPAGEGEAVYVTGSANQVTDEWRDVVWREAFRPTAGARQFTPGEMHERGLRLYVARASRFEVHVSAGHPVHGRGVDTRQPAEPGAPGHGVRTDRDRPVQ